MRLAGGLDLTYCTNIHAGNGWDEVLANVKLFAPELKSRLSPRGPFGLGLRLSAAEAAELRTGGRLAEFRRYLDDEGLYVALLNGYPYGAFHGTRVKEQVFAPDWRTDARAVYTADMIEIAGALLPDDLDGGVSTVPLSYKPWVGSDEDAWWDIVAHLAGTCALMAKLRERTGRLVHLDIEPEPDGLIENTPETISFFRDRLLPLGAPLLAQELGIGEDAAAELLLEHIGVCLDTCHFAIQFENPGEAIRALRGAGIRIGRVQASSALRVYLPARVWDRNAIAADLDAFVEPVYLHQVIARRPDGSLRRFPDLDDALRSVSEGVVCEWRIHCHVPLFTHRFGKFDSTQAEIVSALDATCREGLSNHLEIETYTWSVLPPHWCLHLIDSIEREYHWVLEVSCAKRQ